MPGGRSLKSKLEEKVPAISWEAEAEDTREPSTGNFSFSCLKIAKVLVGGDYFL